MKKQSLFASRLDVWVDEEYVRIQIYFIDYRDEILTSSQTVVRKIPIDNKLPKYIAYTDSKAMTGLARKVLLDE